MEAIKEIITPAAERAKSKILGTFVIAWIIYNWKFIITLILPSTVNIHNKGLLEFIEQEKILNFCHGFLYPLISSAFFIFIYPHADRCIYKYLEEIRRKKIDDKITISRKHSVPGDAYYDLKLEYEKEKEKLLKFENEKKTLNSTISGLENTVNTLRIDDSRNLAQLELARKNNILHGKRSEINFLISRWQLFSSGIKDKEEVIEITSSFEYHTKKINTWGFTYFLRNTDVDILNGRIRFVKFKPLDDSQKKGNESPICIFSDLQIIDNNTLEGYENESIKVTYKRQGNMLSN